jgi:flagellar M-ring protein FliF
MTDQDKRLYLQFQLEQNISQTINQMDKIKSSTVMITLPPQSNYVLSGQNNAKATASVVLELKDGQTLTSSDASTIRSVVSKSVQNLAPEDITIADSKMNTYDSNGIDSDGGGTVNQQLELQAQVAEKLRQQILNLLTPVFGAEKLSASVNVALNFDKSTTNSITLAPPVDNGDNTGLITSMKQTQELVANGAGASGQPGQVTNGGGTVTNQATTSPTASGNYSMITKEINAEVNQINQQLHRFVSSA